MRRGREKNKKTRVETEAGEVRGAIYPIVLFLKQKNRKRRYRISPRDLWEENERERARAKQLCERLRPLLSHSAILICDI